MDASHNGAHGAYDTRNGRWQRALAAKSASRPLPMPMIGRSRAGIGPNKAAGRKGGMRRQGSKRG